MLDDECGSHPSHMYVQSNFLSAVRAPFRLAMKNFIETTAISFNFAAVAIVSLALQSLQMAARFNAHGIMIAHSSNTPASDLI